MKIKATAIRTAMIGGGTSYDVYFNVADKGYRPIAFGTYATRILQSGGEYYRADDFLRTPALDRIPVSEERWNAFQHLRRAADRLAVRVAKRAFPELRGMRKLPELWAKWDKPSAKKTVTVSLRDERLD